MRNRNPGYKVRRRKCDRCGVESQQTYKVSERIRPGGGHLCADCIVPSAVDKQQAAGVS